jgi:hypothetical protein
VTSVVPKANGFDIHFEREGAGGVREQAQTEADTVIFAFGFGVEPQRGIPNTITESYWRDAGVPGPEIGRRRETRRGSRTKTSCRPSCFNLDYYRPLPDLSTTPATDR